MSNRDERLRSLAAKVSAVLNSEFGQLQMRRTALSAVSRLLPKHAGNRARASMLRQMGFGVGDGTLVYGTPNIVGGGENYISKLVIGRDCILEIGCHFDLGEQITIGDRVVIGKEAMFLTTSHELGPREHRAGRLTFGSITIGNGAWIGPRALILPGVTIGEGAIVAPGAIVNKDVEPNTRAAGAPAKKAETLEL